MFQRRRLIGLAAVSALAITFAAPGCGSDAGVDIPAETDSGSDATVGPDGTVDIDSGIVDSGIVDTDSGGNLDGGRPDVPDGSIILPDGGGIVLPDGGILLPDGGVVPIPDGGVVLQDGGVLLPDGGVVQPPDSGGVVVRDGGGTLADGGAVVLLPDGGVACVQTTCQGKVYQCGDCIDNDGDDKIDMADVGCLGPCDNTETDLTLGIPGGNNAPCKADCYFDQDTGSGNDSCVWDHSCDPHETAPNYYPETQSGNKCEYDWQNTKVQGNGTCQEFYQPGGQPAMCGDICGPLTPNGCDCFGCCTFPALYEQVETVQPPGVLASKPKYVWLGSLDAQGNPSCTADKVTDPTKCHSCTPVKACLNTCEPCELCIGKTTLPAECYPKPPGPIPDGGVPLPDGGGTVQPDGGIVLTDGGVVPIPDGGVLLPDGGLALPDGGVVMPDGGTFPPPDAGTLPDGGPVGVDAGAQCGGQLCFGTAACGLACQPACPSGQFCLTGCCADNPR